MREYGVSQFSDSDLRLWPEENNPKRRLRCKDCQEQFGGLKTEDLCEHCAEGWQKSGGAFEICENCALNIGALIKESKDRMFILPSGHHKMKHADWIEYGNDQIQFKGFCIDEHVFELIKLLNEKGIETTASCEGSDYADQGRSSVLLENFDVATKLYAHIYEWAIENDTEFKIRMWGMNVTPRERCTLETMVMLNEEKPAPEPVLCFAYHDINRIVEAIQKTGPR